MATTRVYEVPDVSCGHCKGAIEGELGGREDVAEVVVDVEAKRVRVVGDASDGDLRAALEDLGYPVAGEVSGA